MNPRLETIYASSPVFLQNLYISWYGHRIRSQRFNSGYERWMDFFERSQWWGPDELGAHQDRALAALVAHCYERVPFYRRVMDERRLRWSQFLYGLDWRNPELYDLVLNPEKLRVETMTEAVARIARSAELQPTSHDHERLRNLRLVAVGRAALLRSARTRLLDVTLEADATSGRLRVYGVASSMSIETGERDLRSVLAQVPDITGIDVMLEEDPFR